MISLSKYADISMRTCKPMTSDFEISLGLPELHSRQLSKFVDSLFETYDFDFNDNGIVKSMKLYNESNDKTVTITLHESTCLIDNVKKLCVTEHVDNTLTFFEEHKYSCFTEFKECLHTISNKYKS